MSKKSSKRIQQHTQLESRSWTTEEAFRYCERLTAEHYENFPVASVLLPRNKRRHVAAVYAFSRIADDFADEPGLEPAERLVRLDDWEDKLNRCTQTRSSHPVFIALGETIAKFNLPPGLFKRLLKAFRSDVTVTRFSAYEDVMAYCENSANPVGRLVLTMFGYVDEALMEYSDAICTALQLTNFWQDMSIDLHRDRVYLPEEDLRRFKYSETDLFARDYSNTFKDLMSFQLARTERLFQAGRPLLKSVGKDLTLQLRLTWHGGQRIVEKIRQNDYNVLSQRPTLGMSDWLIIGGRSILRK